MKQAGFSDPACEHKKKTTRKERFLGEMEAILPWKQLLKPILKKYPRPGNGRRPIPAEVMLRIYCMRQWYGLSDPGMEDSLYDIESMRRFAGVSIDSIPDESRILHFRHFLEKHRLTEKLFRLTEGYLSEQDLILSEGTLVDASMCECTEFDEEPGAERQHKAEASGVDWRVNRKARKETQLCRPVIQPEE